MVLQKNGMVEYQSNSQNSLNIAQHKKVNSNTNFPAGQKN